jgi:transcriptional regulator with XRE-family HTH domain
MSKTCQEVAKARMLARDITQQHLADRFGLSKATISHWFTGRHPAPLKYLGKIAEMLDMTLAELLAEDDSLARNATELDLLRQLRTIPPQQMEQARIMISALLASLSQLPPQDHKPIR